MSTISQWQKSDYFSQPFVSLCVMHLCWWTILATLTKKSVLNLWKESLRFFSSVFRSARTSYRTFDVRPSVRPSARPSVRAKNPDHLFSLINHRRTTVNLSKEKKGKREKEKKRKRGKEKKRKREKEKKRKKRKRKKEKKIKREKGNKGIRE